jgi:hypothetical protein
MPRPRKVREITPRPIKFEARWAQEPAFTLRKRGKTVGLLDIEPRAMQHAT